MQAMFLSEKKTRRKNIIIIIRRNQNEEKCNTQKGRVSA